MTTLTPTQLDILAYAVNRTEGRLEWFPPQIRGGAQAKVIKALHDRQLITFVDPVWHVDASGYDALGLPRPGSRTVFQPASEPAQTLADPVKTDPQAEPEAEPRPAPQIRDHSKQATVIALLRRPEGATLVQITEATQWQVHTARGFLAGAVKKRLGLNLTSDKPKGGVRIYRIIEEVAS
ncbi:MAG: hypothetical protein RLZZ09_2908 [Pseudomonadota bacterium]|jgi:hypothetical protein